MKMYPQAIQEVDEFFVIKEICSSMDTLQWIELRNNLNNLVTDF